MVGEEQAGKEGSVNTQIPDGRYTVVYPTGDYRTLRFKTPPAGKSLAGKQIISFKQGKDYVGFAFLFNGQPKFWNKFKAQNIPDRLQKIERAVQRVLADPEQAGLAFAMKENKCYRCGRDLTVPASLHRGMGPECAGKVGGWKKADQQAAYNERAAHPQPSRQVPKQVQPSNGQLEFQYDQFSRDENLLIAEASDLQFPVGQWPTQFQLRYPDGSVHPYYNAGAALNHPEGDVLYVAYTSVTGQPRIQIFND
jgi:hypothetical protein